MKITNLQMQPVDFDYYNARGCNYSTLSKAWSMAKGTYTPISESASTFGTDFHSLLLEGVVPDENNKEYKKLMAMKAAANQFGLLTAVQKEAKNSLVERAFTFELDGVKCKIKPDVVYEMQDDTVIIGDPKSTTASTYSECFQSYIKYNYWIQCGFYLLPFKNAKRFIFEFVQKADLVTKLPEVNNIVIEGEALELRKRNAYEVFRWYQDHWLPSLN